MRRIAFDFLCPAFAHANRYPAAGGTLLTHGVVPGRQARRILFGRKYLRYEKLQRSLDRLIIRESGDGAATTHTHGRRPPDRRPCFFRLMDVRLPWHPAAGESHMIRFGPGFC